MARGINHRSSVSSVITRNAEGCDVGGETAAGEDEDLSDGENMLDADSETDIPAEDDGDGDLLESGDEDNNNNANNQIHAGAAGFVLGL